MKIEIETTNAAFDDDKAEECARILEEIIAHLRLGDRTEGWLRDINGNKVGEWSL